MKLTKKILSCLLCLILLFATMTQYALPIQADEAVIDPAIAIGEGFAVALTAEGKLWSWGVNTAGQLGIGTTGKSNQFQTRPVAISSTATFVAIAAGKSHAVALDADGNVWTWGDNTCSQLGRMPLEDEDEYVPMKISMPSDLKVTAIAVSSNTTYALTEDHCVYVWGSNENGLLGLNNQLLVEYEETPIKIPALSNVVQITANGKTAAAITADGLVWLWGSNQNSSSKITGQIGAINGGARVYQPTCKLPTEEELSYQAAMIALGEEHTSILSSDGRILNMGLSSKGQFGNGKTSANTLPSLFERNCTDLTGIAKIASIAAGNKHMVALTNGGEVYVWGDNTKGQLTDQASANPTLKPLKLTYTGGKAVAVTAAYNTTAIIDDEGHILMWGAGESGQLGNGTSTDTQTPTMVSNTDGSGYLYLGLSSTDISQDVYITATAKIPTPTFQVAVPVSLDFGTLEQKSETAEDRIAKIDFSVSASNIQYLFGKNIIVRIAPSTGDKFVLKGTTSELPYSIYNTASGGDPLATDAQFASFTQAGGTVNGRLEIDQNDIIVADDYSGTLDFIVSLEPNGN